jgi:two-component system sensor histidine kinase/response regulator
MTHPTHEKRILVIDDDEIMRISCLQILKKSGYLVETHSNGHEGLQRVPEFKPEVLVVDIKMPEINGFQVMEKVRKIDPNLVIVVITGYATIGTAVEAMKAGAYDFLPKPFTPDELRLIIARAYEHRSLLGETRRLQREKEEVERRFITLVAHQLKSPLVAVKQILDVMIFTTGSSLPEKAVKGIDRCQARVGELLGIIQDWLALAKIEQAVLCEEGAQADLNGILRAVVDGTHEAQEASNVTVTLDLAKEPSTVRGDAKSLGLLFGNLVDNAIKYNRASGTVTIRSVVEGPEMRVEVRDTGIGIPAGCQDRLFSEFYRVKTEATQNIPGSGLGLALCRKIVSELGGAITLDSQEGVGTTFQVRLPRAAPPAPPATSAPGPARE